MLQCRALARPLGLEVKLTESMKPVTAEDKKFMDQISYASIVGSVMYLMICTHPDVAYSISMTSRFMSNPGRDHWTTLVGILRYLEGTQHLWLTFTRQEGKDLDALIRCVDVDYASSIVQGGLKQVMYSICLG